MHQQHHRARGRRVSRLQCVDPSGGAIMVGVTSENIARLWAIGVPEDEVEAMKLLLEQGLTLIEGTAAPAAALRVV